MAWQHVCFRKLAACNFLWAGDGPDLFANFEEVLVDAALTNWEDIMANIAEADKTAICFDAAVQEMYRKYVGAEARGQILSQSILKL